ncbi:DUF4190 domain-containing protein [Arthrobacter sp. PAMC25564]|nr:DUF4190 domain-containing protein [Arthrobacter sp. PAMC25564]
MTIAERRAAGITTGAIAEAASPTLTFDPDRSPLQRHPAPQASDRTNIFALTSMILGFLGGTVLAIIFGHVAKSQIRRTGERGTGMATAGLILGYFWTSLLIIYVIWLFVAINSMRGSY